MATNKMDGFFEKVLEWKKQTERQGSCVSDHELCPRCNEQLFYCWCARDMAQEIMEIQYGFNEDYGRVKVVTISKAHYTDLLADSDKLAKLEAYGVDNWSGYSDAMNDSEGIFEYEEEEWND